ncbi:MAG: serine hydrolase [Hespellia sp.]|nr:serine hydrolase [Hespellia sp.]
MKWPKQSLGDMITGEVEKKRIPGMILGITTNGKEDHICVGNAVIDAKKPVEADTIFRIFSMSKPVCAVAIHILMERGLILQDDLLSDYIPAFTNMEKWEGNQVVPEEKPIRISHLLSMTAGMTYDDGDNPGWRTGLLIASIHDHMDRNEPFTTQMVAEALANQPLASTPGERWRYGFCADVLGAVIEKVSKKRLGDFYRDEIFEPLHMVDTGFYVPEEKKDRFAVLYKRTQKDGRYCLEEDVEHHLGLGDYGRRPDFESAGAGLVSTYQDYMRFVQMLAGGGILDGVRILGEETVRSFTRNQMTEEQTQGIYFEHMKGYGYGNLMRVRLEDTPAEVPGTASSFGWDGWCGPYMAVDMLHNSGILMFTQLSAYADWDTNTSILRHLLSV